MYWNKALCHLGTALALLRGQLGQLWREGGRLGQRGCPALPEHVWEHWEKLSKCPGLHS